LVLHSYPQDKHKTTKRYKTSIRVKRGKWMLFNRKRKEVKKVQVTTLKAQKVDHGIVQTLRQSVK